MTNIEIIEAAKKGLVANGTIQPEEDIHTYKHWRHLGYQVFRGEKAVAALNIWQYTKKSGSKPAPDEDDEEQEPKPESGYMRMRKAYFFSTKQVFSLE